MEPGSQTDPSIQATKSSNKIVKRAAAAPRKERIRAARLLHGPLRAGTSFSRMWCVKSDQKEKGKSTSYQNLLIVFIVVSV